MYKNQQSSEFEMATSVHADIGGIPHFECHGDPTTIGARWKKWRRAFELFVEGKGIKDNGQKKALLLHCGGMQMQDIFYTFPTVEPEADQTVYSVALDQLDRYFTPQVNVPYERHLFRNISQQPTETIDQLITRLRQKAEFCEFTDKNEQIRDQVIEKCLSHNLRRKLLEKGKNLTLEQLQTVARAMENSEKQAVSIEGTTRGEVNRVQTKRRGDRDRQTGSVNKTCYRCGSSTHLQNSDVCFAKDKECFKCHKVGHLSKCCKTKTPGSQDKQRHKGTSGKSKIRFVETSSLSNDDDYAFSIVDDCKQPTVPVNIGGIADVPMIIDSGASCNVIDKHLWEKLKQQHVKCNSRKTEKKLFVYGSTRSMDVIGCFEAQVSVGNNDRQINAEFTVVREKGQALLGYKTATELRVLKIGIDSNNVNMVSQLEPKELVEKYKSCFVGLGKLKSFQLEIPIDKSVKPVAQDMRKIPFSLRDKLEAKLDELQKLDVIEKAEGPTPWVSPVVVVPKGQNDIRLCVDMRRANEAIIRERHPIPTVEEVLYDLNQSTVFSKLDIKWAFHQIELSEASRSITTFVTHQGLFKYKRLMFGISCAPEMYQRVIQQALQGCVGVRNIFDDIIVHAPTVEEHDARLEMLLKRIQEKGLTLNREKCQFRMDELMFMGHLLSARGIGPDEEKVRAVLEARQPCNPGEVRSFMGLVNFVGRFIPDLSTVSEPLSRLTKKGVPFVWGKAQETAFQDLKGRLANTETLGYFDREAKTIVILWDLALFSCRKSTVNIG